MDRKSYWTLGLWLALAAMVFVGATGCHAKVGLGTVTLDVEIDEWAQANFLKAVDDLIAKVPDPNKKDGGDEEVAADDSVDPGGDPVD